MTHVGEGESGSAAPTMETIQGQCRSGGGSGCDGAFISKEAAYADKPILNRIHSGEWFGDGGLVFAMFWAVALAVLTVSGLIIYLSFAKLFLLGGHA